MSSSPEKHEKLPVPSRDSLCCNLAIYKYKSMRGRAEPDGYGRHEEIFQWWLCTTAPAVSIVAQISLAFFSS